MAFGGPTAAFHFNVTIKQGKQTTWAAFQVARERFVDWDGSALKMTGLACGTSGLFFLSFPLLSLCFVGLNIKIIICMSAFDLVQGRPSTMCLRLD